MQEQRKEKQQQKSALLPHEDEDEDDGDYFGEDITDETNRPESLGNIQPAELEFYLRVAEQDNDTEMNAG